MKDFIKNQITNEIYTKIVELETERNKEKQKIIAQEIINALNIEDYTAYMAYDDEGDIFIALNYYYSSNEIDNSLLNQNHDVSITSDGVYIDDEALLEQFKKDYEDKIILEKKEEKEAERILRQNQKKFNEISDKLELLNNQLIDLVNFQRPKCIGNYEKITKIDKEIQELEELIEYFENKLNLADNNQVQFIDFVNKTGKNVGEIQNTKLADFIGISEGAIRLMKANDLHRLDCLYLGSLCKANNITKDVLIKFVQNRI